MSEVVHLNDTPIHIQDDDFINGYQIGYLHYKQDFKGRVTITDQFLYNTIMQNIIDVQHTGRCNAGYLVGFIAAMIEREPKKRFQIVGKISPEEATPVSEIGGEQQ
jgi:hypothetical protein